MAIGDVMRASGDGVVVESRHPDWQPGARISGLFGMQELAAADGRDFPIQRDCTLAGLKRELKAVMLKHEEDILDGFEHLSRALQRLFRGENPGKQLVRV